MRYQVRQEVFDGFCNWATDIYVDEAATPLNAYKLALSYVTKYRIIGVMAEFYIYDTKKRTSVYVEDWETLSN